jgi:hypothetical protein
MVVLLTAMSDSSTAMSDSSTANTKIDIWSRITLKQLVPALVALGDRINELKTETWRLNRKTRAPGSVWNQVIASLNLDRSERTRQSLYNIWHKNRHQIKELVSTNGDINLGNGASDQDKNSTGNEILSASSGKQLLLNNMTSSPVRVKPKRNVQKSTERHDIVKSSAPCEYSIAFTSAEWKVAFSRTDRKMKSGWTETFAKKLEASGSVCTPRFSTPSFKNGQRKKKSNFLLCYATCTTRLCSRHFHISLPIEPSAGASVLFLVRAYGKERHDGTVETAQRRIQGDERLAMGRYSLFTTHAIKTIGEIIF